MLEATKTLASYAGSRWCTLPARWARSPVEASALARARARNVVLDGWFYDISAVDPTEARRLQAGVVGEGAILVVGPTGEGPIRVYRDVRDFAAHGGDEVRTLCVAGVGSSALGSAAFARNIADATAAPVAAVVSGYGLADCMSEALGGWLLFGSVNRLRHGFDVLDQLISRRPEHRSNLDLVRSFVEVPYASGDTVAALALLLHPGLRFELLVGHSKGNLVLAEALNGLVHRRFDHEAVARIRRIVTIGAAIFMPSAFESHEIVDVMGEWDLFGLLNSSPQVAIDQWIPGAGHHTNTRIPGHLPVRELVESLTA